MIFPLYSVFFLGTTLVSFLVAFLAWERRLVKGARELSNLMMAAGFGAFWLIFETAAPTISQKIFLSKLEFIGGIATPVFYLIFVLRFTGKDRFLSKKHISLLFLIPLITLVLTLTNEWHKLIWSGFSAISEKTNLMEYYHGIGFWIGYIAYSYLMLFLATIHLFTFIIYQNRPFVLQGWIVLIAGLCPWIASVLYLSGSNPVPGLDITPVSIILSGTLAAYSILNIRFLDLVPVARKTLVETLPDGIIALDDHNRIQDINGAALSFLGIENKHVIGLSAIASGACVTQLLIAVLDHESVDQIEIQTGDEIKIFRLIKHAINHQKGSRLVVISDITSQIASQKKILASEERNRLMFSMFRLMADNLDDFLWAKDMDNNYTFVNKAMCNRLLNTKSVEEPLGKTIDFFAQRERDSHKENSEWFTIKEVSAVADSVSLNDTKSKQYDVFGNVNGKFLFLDVHRAPIWDEQGNQIGIVGTARDVTLTKQLENEKTVTLELLRKSENELRKINAERDKFFSIIAHDLRGPFSGFLGLTELLADNLDSLAIEEIQDISLSMKKSAGNLFRLLENLLQWSRIQQGLIPFNQEIVPLPAIFEESVALVLEPAKNKGIEIDTNIPNDLLVFADSNILQTVIRNLISNAVKFTPKGGKISLAAKVNSDKSVEISVKDTGIGMSREMVDNLFRLDVKTNRMGTDGESSTGLGLVLCQEFAVKHGGKIWVESEEEKGSTFYFRFPLN